MSKIFTVVYSTTILASNTNRNIFNSITVPGSKLSVVKVLLPQQGGLTHLGVVQTDGTTCAVNCELLNSNLPYPVTGTQTNYTAGTSAAVPLALCRAFPAGELTASSGNAVERFHEHGYKWNNIDGDSTKIQPYLYLVIAPQGATNPTVWDVVITIEHEIGGN